MEAQLAEYRAKKARERQSQSSLLKKFFPTKSNETTASNESQLTDDKVWTFI